LNRLCRFGFPSCVHRLSHDERGLYLLSIWRDGSRIESQFEWRDVTSAAVFQRDCFSVDLLCLAFFVQAENVEVNEEMPGWKELVKTLPTYLPGCHAFEQWFYVAAFPAFHTNMTTVFDKSGRN
jgi:hypothetical protein